MNQVFLDKIIPAAVQDEKESGVPAEVTVGQAILESSWGDSQLATLANNFFGIKADERWDGKTINMDGSEYLHDHWIHEGMKWRKYDSIADSIKDHSEFLHHPRYSGAFEPEASWQFFITAIARAGYATDPTYASKIITLVSGKIQQQIDRARHEASSKT